MTLHAITSEILTENDTTWFKLRNGSAVSKFGFKCPSYLLNRTDDKEPLQYDSDEDLDVNREQDKSLMIEHKVSTELKLVGQQVWRGALLLADYVLSHPNSFKGKTILELGSGVGLTSIVASFLADQVICTDIRGMLKLIRRNFMRNLDHMKSKFIIAEVDFLNLDWSERLQKDLDAASIILAADVIYDEKITKGFIRTLAKLFESSKRKVAYIALEKRYVFTVADLDTSAPMYDEFLQRIATEELDWSVEHVKIDFPKYFDYDRVKQMVLMKIEPK